MKKTLYAILFGIGALLGGGGLAYAAGLTIPQGGTGWAAFQSGAIPYGNPSSALRFSTTTQGTAGQVLMWSNGIPVWAATSSSASGAVGNWFTPTTNYGALANSTSTPIWFTAGLQASSTSQIAYASTTALSAASLFATNATINTFSGLIGGNSGLLYAFASSSLFGYTPLNPTRALTVAGTANQITSSAGSQDLSADRTWTLSFPAALQFPLSFTSTYGTTTFASSTALAVSSSLNVPNASNPTINSISAGQVAVDNTTASSSIHFSTGAGEFALFASTTVSFDYATSSPVGSTTIIIPGSPRKNGFYTGGCTSIGGTANVQLGNGTASTTMLISTQSLTNTFSTLVSNNVFAAGAARLIQIGTFSGTGVTHVGCTFVKGDDPN